jgi:hypothetical protein
VAGTCKPEYNTNLCPLGKTELEENHGADKLSMRKPIRNRYSFTNPPQALLNARLDNIAIVPASLLPFKQSLQELIDHLPPGGVFLCHAGDNTKQKKLLELVGQAFTEQGHAVVNIPLERFQTNASCS